MDTVENTQPEAATSSLEEIVIECLEKIELMAELWTEMRGAGEVPALIVLFLRIVMPYYTALRDMPEVTTVMGNAIVPAITAWTEWVQSLSDETDDLAVELRDDQTALLSSLLLSFPLLPSPFGFNLPLLSSPPLSSPPLSSPPLDSNSGCRHTERAAVIAHNDMAPTAVEGPEHSGAGKIPGEVSNGLDSVTVTCEASESGLRTSDGMTTTKSGVSASNTATGAVARLRGAAGRDVSSMEFTVERAITGALAALIPRIRRTDDANQWLVETLEFAVWRGMTLVVAFLLAPQEYGGVGMDDTMSGEAGNNTSLLHALSNTMVEGDAAITEAIWDMVIDRTSDINAVDRQLNTPLILAAFYGNYALTVQLVRRGCDQQLLNINKGTAFVAAANAGHIDCTRFLANQPGVDIELRNKNKATALLCAAQDGHVEVVEFLIARGANIEVRNLNEGTPIIVAAEAGHVQVVEMLIAAGAHVNACNARGVTSLQYAAGRRYKEILERLVLAGADVDAVDSSKNTALGLAVAADDAASLALLLQEGADIHNACIQSRRNLLTVATSADCCELLLRYGIDVAAPYSDTYTPEETIARSGSGAPIGLNAAAMMAEWGGLMNPSLWTGFFSHHDRQGADASELVENAIAGMRRRAWRMRCDAVRLFATVHNPPPACEASDISADSLS